MKCNSLVLKIASRCNLNCKYCYMYNMEDKSFELQPRFMSNEIVDSIIIKTFNHCISNNVKEFLFAFHGGEPLLQKPDFFKYFVNKCKSIFSNKVTIFFTIQTNGTLITKEIASLFNDLEIQIGISIDGIREINDENRLYKNNKSSFDDVLLGIKNAFDFKFHKNTLGILSVINLENNPLEFYDFLKEIKIKNFDLLFPYNSYDNLPKSYKVNDINHTPYADWLIKLFNIWYLDSNIDRPNIRMFNGFIECFFGGEYPNDLFGNYKNGLLVIETNGDIEAVDYLKACGQNFTKTDLNILKNEISDSINSELINLYYHSHNKLNSKCNQCNVKEICGGGNLVSRYSKTNGFDNASFLCSDFLKLILFIQNITYSNLPKDLLDENNIEISSFEKEHLIINSLSNKQYDKYLTSFKSIKS
ncbi:MULTISPECIES: radical SAM protein [Flavobacterium]|nr:MULTISPECIES: radical SAM protein [Flavobacterium]